MTNKGASWRSMLMAVFAVVVLAGGCTPDEAALGKDTPSTTAASATPSASNPPGLGQAPEVSQPLEPSQLADPLCEVLTEEQIVQLDWDLHAVDGGAKWCYWGFKPGGQYKNYSLKMVDTDLADLYEKYSKVSSVYVEAADVGGYPALYSANPNCTLYVGIRADRMLEIHSQPDPEPPPEGSAKDACVHLDESARMMMETIKATQG